MSQDKKKRIEVSAIGTKGMLIQVAGKFYFRVTKTDGSLVDYKLTHHDLMVEIVDSDAAFYQDEDGNGICLDYPSSVYGRKKT